MSKLKSESDKMEREAAFKFVHQGKVYFEGDRLPEELYSIPAARYVNKEVVASSLSPPSVEQPKLQGEASNVALKDSKRVYTKKELEDMKLTMTFTEFKAFAKKEFNVSGTGWTEVVNDILKVQVTK